MTVPIDYNKMQKELDKRKYMGQIYTGKIETWQATKLGLKTYGKWCDLAGWENLVGEKCTSTDDFMNLAVKRKWVEIVYSFEKKENICMQTKFGHDLFKTFEYWIDENAQKRVVRKKQINGIMTGFQKLLQGMPKFMQQISTMMASLAPSEKSKPMKRGKKKSNKPKKQQQSDNYTGDQWQDWNKKWNQERKDWWKI